MRQCVTYLMQQTTKTVLSDPVNADLVLPIAHWGSKMNWKMNWVQGHVERRKFNQEDWADEKWVNVFLDELAGKAWTPTPSTSMPPTTWQANNNIAFRFTQCSSLQVLHKEKSNFFARCNHTSRWCRPALKLSITPTQLPINHPWPYTTPSLFVRQCVACAHGMIIGMQRKMNTTLMFLHQTNLAGNGYEMRQ